MLRHGGQRSTHQHELLGTNSRLDEIQAAILRVKLCYLDDWNKPRRILAARYDSGLGGYHELTLPAVRRDVEHAYHLYVVRTPLRDALHDYLAWAMVTTSVHYPCGVHRKRPTLTWAMSPTPTPTLQRRRLRFYRCRYSPN